MRFKKIVDLFENHSVCVSGMKGSGKDILFGNVINRRKIDYISNLDYGGYYHPLLLKKFDIPNNYANFINGNVLTYDYDYPLGADVYISDVGVYLPSQYCNQLNKEYPGLITFQALSRQIAMCRVHINVQSLNRAWDKLREQSDFYIRCRKCFFLFGFVIQTITLYDKYESCLNRINPCRVRVPFLAKKEVKMNAQLYLDNFYNQNGEVKNKLLIYRNKSKHDTYYFGKLLGTLKEGFSPKEIKQDQMRKRRAWRSKHASALVGKVENEK